MLHSPPHLDYSIIAIVLRKAHQPDFVADLLDSDVLAGEHDAQLDSAPPNESFGRSY
jgi:hypothetical protein